MATATYTPIASITLGSSASSVTFSSIPQTYRDLVLVVNVTADSGSTTGLEMNINDSGSLERVDMTGTGSSTSSSSTTSATQMLFTSSNPTLNIAQFMDYSSQDKHKTWLTRVNDVSGFVRAYASRYSSTAAITKIEIFDNGSVQMASGSTFSLYGIEA